MALADVIVQSSPEKEQAIKMLDDMKNRLDGMLDDAWNARSSEIEYGERQSVRWHCEKGYRYRGSDGKAEREHEHRVLR